MNPMSRAGRSAPWPERARGLGAVGAGVLAAVLARAMAASAGLESAGLGEDRFASRVASAPTALAAVSVAEPARAVTTPEGAAEHPSVRRAPSAERGAELVRRFECNRCHELAGVPAAPLEKHCVDCHRAIGAGQFDAPAAALARWRPLVAPLAHAPSLHGAGLRLRAEWIAGYLLRPHDLRPGLVPTMPSFAMGPDDAADIAAHLTRIDSSASPPPPQKDPLEGGDPDRGRRLFEAKQCGTCHAFSGAVPPVRALRAAPAASPAVALAPDLRFTRDRFRREALIGWLLDPASMKPDTAMPRTPLDRDEARDLAAFLVMAPLSPAPPAPPLARLPVLARKVRFEEVSRRVLRKTCWHCHSEPDYARGDGGPGNTGGFGFRPRGLVLADYTGVVSGSLDDAGERRSVLAPEPGGPPRLVAALLARHDEEAGRAAPVGIRGMPLGMPPLSLEDIQLVETWIAQGCPR